MKTIRLENRTYFSRPRVGIFASSISTSYSPTMMLEQYPAYDENNIVVHQMLLRSFSYQSMYYLQIDGISFCSISNWCLSPYYPNYGIDYSQVYMSFHGLPMYYGSPAGTVQTLYGTFIFAFQTKPKYMALGVFGMTFPSHTKSFAYKITNWTNLGFTLEFRAGPNDSIFTFALNALVSDYGIFPLTF